jgi:hypothetical protein
VARVTNLDGIWRSFRGRWNAYLRRSPLLEVEDVCVRGSKKEKKQIERKGKGHGRLFRADLLLCGLSVRAGFFFLLLFLFCFLS